ncbi:hypothetical protein JK358_17505 [Nocardia sp. 2]|uniref:Integral membrane protein n=1 Tax=Nocardia acididurans TaxID=2802282 RepID=A0ABS1M6D5_9NOCA|nr:hypothetical protein [Nocardia acididurans]MBL1076198.1 hypothetical protein [Nocardia acididurans]
MVEDAVRLDGNTLVLPGGVGVRFIRTLRLPETGTHPLPPGLGEFPVRRVQDYADSVPDEWRTRGGVMLPMYLREAMWLSFTAKEPAALQIGVGKVCAVSGEPWSDKLTRQPQNYVILPRQPWLDGINSGAGTIRQFVAVPMGLGATVEGQVTGEEVWGGIQLQHFGLTDAARAEWREVSEHTRYMTTAEDMGYTGSVPAGDYGSAPMAPPSQGYGAPPPAPSQGGYSGPAPAGPAGATPLESMPSSAARAPRGAAAGRGRQAKAMGLGVGGTMRQEIYQDDRPLTDWAAAPSGRLFVHLVTPPDWRHITGEAPPPSPVDRAAYTAAGLPWFDYFDSDGADISPAGKLADVAPVGEWLGADHEPWQEPKPGQVKPLKPGKKVEDGEW